MLFFVFALLEYFGEGLDHFCTAASLVLCIVSVSCLRCRSQVGPPPSSIPRYALCWLPLRISFHFSTWVPPLSSPFLIKVLIALPFMLSSLFTYSLRPTSVQTPHPTSKILVQYSSNFASHVTCIFCYKVKRSKNG